jgi:hypothetical protein
MALIPALARLRAGRTDVALKDLTFAAERLRGMFGEQHPRTAQARGALAMAYRAAGDSRRALGVRRGHAGAGTPIRRTQPRRARRLWRRAGSVITFSGRTSAYSPRSGALPSSARRGSTLPPKPFASPTLCAHSRCRLRSMLRRRGPPASTPALAALIREEQDARKRLDVLKGTMVNALSGPDPASAGAITALRKQIDALRRAADEITRQIAREFPAYAQLTDPPLATVDQVRRFLRSDEALLSLYVTRDQTFVWAIPRTGDIAFHAAPAGAEALERPIAALRAALAPTATTLDEIPSFDVVAAHELYRLPHRHRRVRSRPPFLGFLVQGDASILADQFRTQNQSG